MRIGELSKRTGIAASRIRFYDRNGVLPQPDRSENGYRDYPDSTEKMLCVIESAQRVGFTLGEIRAGFNDAAPNLPSREAMIRAFRKKLKAYDDHIKEARSRRLELVRLLAEMGADGNDA